MDESFRFSTKMGISDDIVEQIRRQSRIIIEAGRDVAQSYSGQIMIEVTANLLARMYPHVEVVVPDEQAVHLKSAVKLREHLTSVIADAYHWQGYSLGDIIRDIHVIVGEPEVMRTAIYIDADGWLAYVGDKPSNRQGRTDALNPIGSVSAACLGTAEVFKKLYCNMISRPFIPVTGGIWFNTLTYEGNQENSSVNGLNLQRTVLFGAGSVGSSLLYTLGFMPDVQGHIDIVDRDRYVDYPNLQRYALLTVSDVRNSNEITKARWAAEKLAIKLPKLSITAWDGSNGTVNGYLDANLSSPGINIAVSAVDNTESRIQIADCLARRTINAGTGDTTLTITRHGFGDGRACLACEYIGQIRNVNWYQEVSNRIGLPVDRVAFLLDGLSVMDENDLRVMVAAQFITSDQIAFLIGTDLASLVNRRLYSAVSVQSNGIEKPVTAPFVSLMAGALLAGELIKEAAGLSGKWPQNKYRTDMLSVPTVGGSYAVKAIKDCLCQNMFRKAKYDDLCKGAVALSEANKKTKDGNRQ